MKKTAFFSCLLLASVALAAGGEHGGHGGIPTKLVTYQTINVAMMIAGLIYFLREPIRKHFQEKRAGFLSAASKAETARKAAEQEREGIQVRLSKLESTADESVARARAEAAEMKKQMIAEAEAISKRIREEAELAARMEVEKAKGQLREALIAEALGVARSNISKKVTAEDHQRLQSDFIHNIQAVQK